MAKKFLLLFVVLLSEKVPHGMTDEQCTDSFEGAGIMPDIIDHCENTDLQVSFPGLFGFSKIKCGDSIPLIRTALPPRIQVDVSDICEDRLVQLVLFNPDKPFTANYSHVLWQVFNINPTDLKDGYQSGSDGAIEYQRYMPPASTGNRYIFVLYCQKYKRTQGNATPTLRDRIQLRTNFYQKKYLNSYGLDDPASCFYFTSKII